MTKNKLLLLVSTLFITGTLTGCDHIRRSHFLDMCVSRPSDEPMCKCTFKVLDQKLTPAYGKTWIYRPDLGQLPLFNQSMYQAERQCLQAYYPD